MRQSPIKLEIDKLVGYTLGGAEGNQVRKVGSTKLGCKVPPKMREELAASDDRVDATA